MELTVQVAALCLLTAVLTLLIRRGDSALAFLVPLGAAVAVLLLLFGTLGEIGTFLGELTGQAGVEEAVFLPLYKTAGIALVVKLGGDLCRDAGESALASVLETVGSVCALLVALPLLRAALELLLELIQT
jgi:stage III sporulation protein AD